jgi:HD superfamily phosphohydrolase
LTKLSQLASSIRDPLYGLIPLMSPELSVLSSIAVTRMRWIKQMGLAGLVFPGANHTRFEHSIGTMFVADRLMGALIKKTEDSSLKEKTQEIRFAALLHDLGHSPFSHVTEEFFRANPRYLPPLGDNYDHEVYTELLIRNNEDLKEVCKDQGINIRFISRLACGKSGSYLDGLLSSAIDVDKIDYVARDSYFCGLPYGRIDLSSLADGITITENSLGKEALAFEEKSREAVEGLLMSRFYLATTIHVDERNCAASQLLFRAMREAYDLVLKPAIKKNLDAAVKKLLLDCLHFRWVDHDLMMFLQDPFQKLRIAAIEATRENFSSLDYDALKMIIDLISTQPIKRKTRYFSHILLNSVLRGKIPTLRQSVSLSQLPPSVRYSLLVLYSNSQYTGYINNLTRELQRLKPYKGKKTMIALSAPKPVEMDAKILTAKNDISNLFDLSLLVRSLSIETANRLKLSIYSYRRIKQKIPLQDFMLVVHLLCDLLRRKTIKQNENIRTDLLLMLYYSIYHEMEFFEGDMRFQALFSVVYNRIIPESRIHYKELVKLPTYFGDLSEAENYKNFGNKGYPDFYSVKFAQDLDLLTEIGLIYSRSGPVRIITSDSYAKRYERRISRHGRDYVERFLLKRYPFSSRLRKIVSEITDSNSPLVKLGK